MKAKKVKNLNLGQLEAEIMEIMWDLKKASVREVLKKLRRKRKIAYTTVMTVMSRLFEKDILKRKLNDSGAYIYTPTQDKQSFLTTASKNVINGLIEDFGEVAVAQFIDIVENTDAKNLEELRKKLKKL